MISRIKSILLYFLITTGVVFWIITLYEVTRSQGATKVYNCELAEISPDFPIEVRNECRRIRSGQRV